MRSSMLLGLLLGLSGCDAAFRECEDGNGVANDATCAAIYVVAVPALIVASPILFLEGDIPVQATDHGSEELFDAGGAAADGGPPTDATVTEEAPPEPALAP